MASCLWLVLFVVTFSRFHYSLDIVVDNTGVLQEVDSDFCEYCLVSICYGRFLMPHVALFNWKKRLSYFKLLISLCHLNLVLLNVCVESVDALFQNRKKLYAVMVVKNGFMSVVRIFQKLCMIFWYLILRQIHGFVPHVKRLPLQVRVYPVFV